jgi:hypothetical protein
MYTFHASEPDSLPPPVSFSPPKAPPISAPEVPILTFAIPQSEPHADKKLSVSERLAENTEEERPCFTLFCILIASQISPLYLRRYKIGAKVSFCTVAYSFLAYKISLFT